MKERIFANLRVAMGLSASKISTVDVFVNICADPAKESTKKDLMELASSECHVLNASSTSGNLALVAALDAANEVAVKWILTDPFSNLRINNRTEDEGRTALMAACSADPEPVRLFALRTIIQKWGKELKYLEQDDVNKWSALHYCAYHNNAEAARLLLEAEERYTSAAIATATSMQPGLASLLDHYGQSVLHIAASKGHVHTLQLLLKMCYTTHTCTDTSKCGILILPSRAGNVGVRSRDREGFSAIDVAEGVEGEEEGEVEGRSDAEAVRDILLKHEMLQLGGTEC